MRNVEIEVFPIAKTQVDRNHIQHWLDYLNANNYDIPSEEMTTDPALLIAVAAKRCYLSFEPGLNPNVTKVRSDLTAYIDNILKSGHGSVLEHSSWSFAIEGVSRVFTAEMNRHRAGVGVSEGSMRYIRFNDIPWWMPPSMKLTQEEIEARILVDNHNNLTPSERIGMVPPSNQEFDLASLARKKDKTQAIFQRHYNQTEQNYEALLQIWKDELAPESKFHGKKQVTSMIRRIVPMGVATGGVWTMNIRALRHIIAMRASEAAEEEICYVFGKIAKIMTEDEPMLFGDFKQTPEGFWAPNYKKV
jgi:thymidylate synthase (FAD)